MSPHDDGARPRTMLAVVPVRDDLPAGGLEAIAETGGHALLAGVGSREAAADLDGLVREVHVWEAGAYRPGGWAVALAPVVRDVDIVVLPASPDGRDLAPRLAHALDRPLVTAASRVVPGTDDEPGAVTVVRHGGRAEQVVPIEGPIVVTMNPGCRTVTPDSALPPVTPERLQVAAAAAFRSPDAGVIAVLPADPTTMDLVEAKRIVGGGAGLGSAPVFAKLGEIGAAVGASLGATRVVTDAGWAPHQRQIGTTGVEVDPDLYLAFGISGAVQHVMGLGDPDHVISVNLDGSCPMMAMADVAIVADAVAVVDELARRFGLEPVARDGRPDDTSQEVAADG